jgi:hypothetical protein
MDLALFTGMITNILITFFKSSIWVVGFFYLLLRTINNKDVETLAKYVIPIVLAIIFFHSIIVGYTPYTMIK